MGTRGDLHPGPLVDRLKLITPVLSIVDRE